MMSRIIQKSLDTMKDGLDSLKNIKEDKRVYRAYVRRVRSLPNDYQFVYEKITRYMWSFSGGGATAMTW